MTGFAGFADSPVNIETERLILSMPPPDAAPAVAAYYARNRDHLRPWEPRRPPSFFTAPHWRERLGMNRAEYAADQALRLMLVPRDLPSGNGSRPAPGLPPGLAIVGVCNFTCFERGPFRNCRLGYSLDAELQGRGYMREALTAAIAYVFDELGFHRVEANYLPHNQRSGELLRRLGFAPVGYARDYLYIDGAWRDHVLTAIVNPAG